MLNKEERLQIIESQLKTLAYSKYGLDLNILRENARSKPSQQNIDTLGSQVSDIEAEIDTLLAEKARVEAEVESA